MVNFPGTQRHCLCLSFFDYSPGDTGETYGAAIWQIPELYGQLNSPQLERIAALDDHSSKIKCTLWWPTGRHDKLISIDEQNLFLWSFDTSKKNAQYHLLANITVVIGCCFAIIFHLGTKEPRVKQVAQEIVRRSISWTQWLKNGMYYRVACIYVLTRVVTNISQEKLVQMKAVMRPYLTLVTAAN